MGYADDPEGYKRAVEAKLQPENIRFPLMFASLLQMIHERLKLDVLEAVREFYSVGCDDSGRSIVNEDAYRRKVLDLAPKNKFRASLLCWSGPKPSPRRWRIGWTISTPIGTRSPTSSSSTSLIRTSGSTPICSSRQWRS
ncbi:hypothetical protein AB0F85_25180 [Nocardia fluminea]|uniref:hypothetical protein n=1 Tax=Nocardia fluminea TaxID=134984 RepID=UPI0033CD00C4